MVRILLLGPNRWPSDAADPLAGLKVRRSLIDGTSDLDAEWLLLEDSAATGDLTRRFLALAKDPATSHLFILWPRDAKMAGTEDELILWQALSELHGDPPECYLFHQEGVFRVEARRGDHQLIADDPQGKSPYLYGILARGVYEQEWVDLSDLQRQIRQVLIAELGVRPRGEAARVGRAGGGVVPRQLTRRRLRQEQYFHPPP